MIKNIKFVWIASAFMIGLAVGALSGAVYYAMKISRIEASALTYAVADTTAGLMPLLVGMNEDDFDRQMAIIEPHLRALMINGIVLMHINRPILDDDDREIITDILQQIASERDRLQLGQYADPPRDDIEEILMVYAK